MAELLLLCALRGRVSVLSTAVRRLHSSSIKSTYPLAMAIQTRMQDTDMQGHINNVWFYSYMDTAVCNSYLSDPSDSFEASPRFIVESGMEYLKPVHYPYVQN